MIKKSKETTFKDILEIFLPKLWLMILVAAMLAALVSVYSVFVKDETYSSSSIVYVYSERNNTNSTSTGDLQAAEEMVNVYKIAITRTKFLKLVIANNESLSKKHHLSPAAMQSMISISQVEETAVFKITVTSTDPILAYDVAVAVTSGIETYVQGESGLVKNALLSSVLEDPTVPTSPNGKGTVTKAIIAFAVGFILTALIVWARSFFDVIIRSTKKIEDNLDVPILGVIPRHEIYSAEEGKE